MKGSNGIANANNIGVKMSKIPSAPAQAPEDDPDNIGRWLCDKGPYQKYIAAMSGYNPGLLKPDPMNKKHPLVRSLAQVVLLEAAVSGVAEFKNRDFRNTSDLRKHFENDITGVPKRRIYIMEGLAPDYIDVMGSHFFMDPSFFLRQERTCVWSNDFTPTSDALSQPSLLSPEQEFHLQYCELRQFTHVVENIPYFCKRTGRHVGMTAARQAEESTTGILRRKVSWWCRKTNDEGWDVVILCDPQLCEPVSLDGESLNERIKNKAFQGGYVDFLPPPSPQRAFSKRPHPHTSMLKDLSHYFLNHSDLIPEKDWADPVASSLFVKKILAAHHLQLVDYIKAMLPSLELRLTTAWKQEQDQWKSLQTISRRCGNYCDDIEDTLLSLGIPLSEVQSNVTGDWKDCNKDFQYIYFRLKILKQRTDTLMQAMTGLASIAGNRQNLEEAKRVKRLNLLALLFIPLAYTSSLFSMQDNYAPNKGKFWVYWVCAIIVVSVTSFATWVLDQALNDEAQWILPFKFWGKQGKDVKDIPKRKPTGLSLFE